MKKVAISVVAVACMAVALWSLFRWTSEQDLADDSSISMGLASDSEEPAADAPELEQPRSTEPASASRSAAPLVAQEELEPAPAAAEPDPELDSDEGDLGIEVLVVDTADRPIEGASVHYQKANMGFLEMARTERFRVARPKTNAQGLVRLTREEDGLVRLIAEAESRAAGVSDVIDVGGSAAPDRVKITLTEGGSAEGQLMDIHGVPAAHIAVTLMLVRWPGSSERVSSLRSERTKTAEDGTFLFEHLSPGSYTFYTHAKGEDLERVPQQQVQLEVVEGERTEVQLAQIMDTYVRVQGRVIRNSEPLANARINVGWADRTRGHLRKKAKANESGIFSIILDEGAAYRFQVSAPDGKGSLFKEVEIPSVKSYEFEISFDTSGLSGFLLGPDGEPVEGQKIIAFGRPAEGAAGSSIQSTTSTAGGAFAFSNLVSGQYRLLAATIRMGAIVGDAAPAPQFPHLGRVELKDLELPPGESMTDLELRMSAAAAIAGRVVDADGKTVAGAVVEVRGQNPIDGSRWKATPSGDFLAGGLGAGRFRLRASRQDQVSPWVSIVAETMATVTVDDLVLQPGTLVDIETPTVNESGSYVHASVVDDHGRQVESGILLHGKVRLGPFFPGTYTVKVSQSGGDKLEASQKVTLGGEASVKVELDPTK